MEEPIFAAVAALCAGAALAWARAAQLRSRLVAQLDRGADHDASRLARSELQRELVTVAVFGVAAIGAAVAATTTGRAGLWAATAVIGPAIATGVLARDFTTNARIARSRAELEQRARDVLTQDALAPKRWAARLAPEELPDLAGFEVGRAFQAGSGLMAGDFFDVFRVAPTRVAAVIGDVTGHGIEPAITAFQAKYLLRVFLSRYRDPAQALEELNRQMAATTDREEEFISVAVVVFDTEAGTLRHASAGHPPAWLWHDRDAQPLSATGPLVLMAADASYFSREVPLAAGDICLLYTDGLAEARNGAQHFGEDRIGNALRRDPGVPPGVLCKSLLEAAVDFSSGPLSDDVAILAIRRI